MDEWYSASVRRETAGCGILETLNNVGLTAAVASNNHGRWGKKLDDGDSFVVRRADTPNRELVQRTIVLSGQYGRGDSAVKEAKAGEFGPPQPLSRVIVRDCLRITKGRPRDPMSS